MIVTFWILMILYCLMTLVLLYGWEKGMPDKPYGDKNNKLLTVLIPVRNEAKNLEDLLHDLENQNYPANCFNVIVIDDNSEDETARIAEQYGLSSTYDLKVLPLQVPAGFRGSHKKLAISQGVKNTRSEFVVCTDGDCRLGRQWLSVIEDYYKRHQAHFISGPVVLEGSKKWWHNIQIMEFSSLIGAGAASLKLGMPNMCNGANMGFRRDTFVALGGYKGFEHIHSGDDEFLMYKIFSKHPEKVHFLKDARATVKTSVKNSLSAFIHQRKRWSGKWKFHRQISSRLLALFIFIVNLALIVALFWLIAGKATPIDILPLLLLKFSVDFLFVNAVLKFFNKKVNLRDFLILELFYPFYAVFFGLFSNLGTYKWKGRKLNN